MDVSITLTKHFDNRANAQSAADAISDKAKQAGWQVTVRTYTVE